MLRPFLFGISTLICTSSASAELLRYVDSEGKVHLMQVESEGGQEDSEPAQLSLQASQKYPEVGSLEARLTSFAPEGALSEIFPESARYEMLIQQSALAHQVAPDLIRAVIRVESNFNPHALSEAGAEGLMQLMPRTAQELGVLDRREARENIAAGALYLSRLIRRFNGDLVLSLAAYHAGPTRVERLGRVPDSKVTRHYVSKVMFYYYEYAHRRLGGSEKN